MVEQQTQVLTQQVLAYPTFEILPLKSGTAAASHLPSGAQVAVTCSPAQGVDATLAFATQLATMDVTPVVHLAARRIVDQAHLDRLLSDMAKANIRRVFVIAGDDTDTPGLFASGHELVRELREREAALDSIGVPCYPEGHGFIDDTTLDQALIAKAEGADYMVSQICFNAEAILDWLVRVQQNLGIELPLHVGVPGVIARTRLLKIAMRIGIGDSLRFLRQNTGLVGGLLSGSEYRPDALIQALASGFQQRGLTFSGLHINTFNQVKATQAWRRSWLGSDA